LIRSILIRMDFDIYVVNLCLYYSQYLIDKELTTLHKIACISTSKQHTFNIVALHISPT